MDCFPLASAIGELFGSAFWVLAFVGGVLLLRRNGGERRRRPRTDPVGRSLSTLNERYARGEIDRDEYLERRAYLE